MIWLETKQALQRMSDNCTKTTNKQKTHNKMDNRKKKTKCKQNLFFYKFGGNLINKEQNSSQTINQLFLYM
jgi:hypothetical protein